VLLFSRRSLILRQGGIGCCRADGLDASFDRGRCVVGKACRFAHSVQAPEVARNVGFVGCLRVGFTGIIYAMPCVFRIHQYCIRIELWFSLADFESF
jgi:hypothetical protein